MSAKNSHLTIREDLLEEDPNISVPIRFLDHQEDAWIGDSDTLYIDEVYSPENGEQLDDMWGYNMIIKITDPNQKDQYGNVWKDRLAFAISADFDWN
tara:strand:- start:397 stop:687 length:291 start_codon:yes stop_codon:yes gene_type:complete